MTETQTTDWEQADRADEVAWAKKIRRRSRSGGWVPALDLRKAERILTEES